MEKEIDIWGIKKEAYEDEEDEEIEEDEDEEDEDEKDEEDEEIEEDWCSLSCGELKTDGMWWTDQPWAIWNEMFIIYSQMYSADMKCPEMRREVMKWNVYI